VYTPLTRVAAAPARKGDGFMFPNTAGRAAQALPYWIQAGRQAIRRAAHVEAREHLRRGLAALQTLPAAPERAEQELTLQLLLGTTRSRRRRTLPL